MSERPLGIGIVGTGGISRAHVAAYRQSADLARIVGVCDVNPEAVARAKEEFGAELATTSLDELLACDDVEAVSVTVPTNLHADVAVAALRAGKHVLCEKPMAGTGAQAKAMCDAAAAAGKTLMIAMKWRFRPETIAARQAVADGLMGDIYYASAIGWQTKGVPAKPSFIRKELAWGGGMMDNGIYNLDTILYVLGHPRPLTVSAQVGAWFGPQGGPGWRPEDFTVEDFGATFVRLEGGIALFFAHAWHVNLDQAGGLQVAGSRGGIEFDLLWGSRKLSIKHGTYEALQDITPDPLPVGNQALGDFGHEVREFVSSIQEGRPSPVPGDPFYHSNLIFDAAFASAAAGREVVIPWE